MRISLWSWFLCGMKLEEAIRTFVEHGFACSELSSEHGNEILARGDAARSGAALKVVADDHGFSFPQAHFDLGTDICQPAGSRQRREMMDTMKRWCEMFAALGVRAGVLHPGGERLREEGWERGETLEVSAEVLQELLEYVAGTPTRLCLENAWYHEETMQLVDEIDSPDLCVCMDTGHLNVTGGNWAEFSRWAGSRLKALHIADNLGTNDDHILPYGLGTIDWEGFADALRSVGYEGLFNFEVGGETRYRPLDLRLAKLDYVRELALVMLGESGGPG